MGTFRTLFKCVGHVVSDDGMIVCGDLEIDLKRSGHGIFYGDILEFERRK
jgi:hypothetical protein